MFLLIRVALFRFFVTFEPSQLTVKSNEVPFIGFLCSFLCPPQAHERKERSANLQTALLCLFFLNGYPSRPYFGVRRESPIDFFIGKSAVNVFTHHHSTILNDLLSCFFSALGNQPPQKLPRRCIVSVLCKLSSSYSQNSAISNLCSLGSPLDNLRWVSQKWCAP